MKAIILAAGIGYRLLPLTHDLPKALVKISDKTFLDWIIQSLIVRNIRDIVVVVGYKKEMVKSYLLEKYKQQLNITFVENDDYYKTNNIYSLWLAREYLKNDDVLLFECDEIFEQRVLDLLLESPWENIALVDKYKKEFDEGTVVLLNGENDIVELLTKGDEIISSLNKDIFYKTVNIYKFSIAFLRNHFLPYLDVYIKSQEWDQYYEIILKLIIVLKQPRIKGLSIEGCKWIEVDTLTDLRRANFIFFSPEEQLETLQTSFGGFWNYKFDDFSLMGNEYFPSADFLSDITYMSKRLIKKYPSRQDIIDVKLANTLEMKPENVVCLNGSSQGIKIIMDKFNLKYFLPLPTFNEYIRLAKNFDLYKFDCEKLDWHIEDIVSLSKEKNVDGLVLINPNNPTSTYIDRSSLVSILKELSFLKLIIIDESFVDFTEDGGMRSEIDKFENLLIIKSLGKSMGIAGLRLGAAISVNKELIKLIKGDLPIWNINSFAEYFLEIFSRYKKEYEISLKKIRLVRDEFYKRLTENPYIDVVKPHANLIFLKLKKNSPVDAYELTLRLYKDFNILIKNYTDRIKQYSDYSGRGFIRFAINTPEKNERLISAIEKIMSIKGGAEYE